MTKREKKSMRVCALKIKITSCPWTKTYALLCSNILEAQLIIESKYTYMYICMQSEYKLHKC